MHAFPEAENSASCTSQNLRNQGMILPISADSWVIGLIDPIPFSTTAMFYRARPNKEIYLWSYEFIMIEN